MTPRGAMGIGACVERSPRRGERWALSGAMGIGACVERLDDKGVDSVGVWCYGHRRVCRGLFVHLYSKKKSSSKIVAIP